MLDSENGVEERDLPIGRSQEDKYFPEDSY
jgi:hypothetical protein